MERAPTTASGNARELNTNASYTPGIAAPPRSGGRIQSIDIVRGAIMVLMAIDHVRVYAGVPPGGPTPGVFFTRWITNYCAPIFFFLAGTGAYLYASRVRDTRAVARWLAVRGAWLVLLELTVLRFAWTFNFDYAHYMLAGVIWSLGICMILMAALIFLPLRAIASFGVAVIVLHNAVFPALLRASPGIQTGSGAWLWKIAYFGGPIPLAGPDGPVLMVLYSIIPWIGVMAAGYAFGAVMQMPPDQRRRICFALGVACVAAFLILRGLNLYGDPRPWNVLPTEGPVAPAFLRFLNTSKYPASLSFLLMTLGPMFLALPLLEHARGKVADVLSVFGRVPLFYYLLHIPVIHATALLLALLRGGNGAAWLIGNHPVFVDQAPDGYRWSLGLLYLVTAAIVALLYFPCRWFARQRAARPDSWLRYL